MIIKLLNTTAQGGPSDIDPTPISGTTFQITDAKGYVPIGTLQTKDNNKSDNLINQ